MHCDLKDIQKAAELLKAGELVAFPTETVYGLGALGLSDQAIRKVFEAKGRPAYNPLILHVSSVEKARELLELEDDRLFWELAKKYWPGPLTLVASKKALVPTLATGGLEKVAVRVPAHPVALELLRQVGAPLVAPSANASGRPSSTTAEHVMRTLGDKISMVLDAGPCEWGIESTVVDISQNRPVILRPGALNLDGYAYDCAKGSKGSPGRLDKHYAPLIPEIRFSSLGVMPAKAGIRVGFLLRSHTEINGAVCEILPNDPIGYAKGLFAALYRLEQAGIERLWIEEIPKDKAWDSVRDRLSRALTGD